MKVSEMREKSIDELNKELIETRREQLNFRMQSAMGQAPKHSAMTAAKKRVAQLKTILKEKGFQA